MEPDAVKSLAWHCEPRTGVMLSALTRTSHRDLAIMAARRVPISLTTRHGGITQHPSFLVAASVPRMVWLTFERDTRQTGMGMISGPL
jgi:hypothetical protein